MCFPMVRDIHGKTFERTCNSPTGYKPRLQALLGKFPLGPLMCNNKQYLKQQNIFPEYLLQKLKVERLQAYAGGYSREYKKLFGNTSANDASPAGSSHALARNKAERQFNYSYLQQGYKQEVSINPHLTTVWPDRACRYLRACSLSKRKVRTFAL